MKVLVVDDEPAIGQMLRSAFEMNGSSVEIAFSAESALQVFREGGGSAFDLLLVDKNLPGGMSGVDFIREIRQADPHVAIMMITAYGTPESIVQTINLGIDSYLDKPFDSITELVGAAQVIVERRKQNQKRKADPERKLDVMAVIRPGALQRTDLVEVFAKVRSRLIVFDSASELLENIDARAGLVVLDADLLGPETPAILEKAAALGPAASFAVVTSRDLGMDDLKKLVSLGVVALYNWSSGSDWRARMETLAQKLFDA